MRKSQQTVWRIAEDATERQAEEQHADQMQLQAGSRVVVFIMGVSQVKSADTLQADEARII